MKFLLYHSLKIFIWGGGGRNLWWGIKIWWEESTGGDFSWWGTKDEYIFSQWGKASLHPPSKETAVESTCIFQGFSAWLISHFLLKITWKSEQMKPKHHKRKVWRASGEMNQKKKTLSSVFGLKFTFIHQQINPDEWKWCNKISFALFFKKKLGFTPCKAEQPLQSMQLQEKEAQKD